MALGAGRHTTQPTVLERPVEQEVGTARVLVRAERSCWWPWLLGGGPAAPHVSHAACRRHFVSFFCFGGGGGGFAAWGPVACVSYYAGTLEQTWSGHTGAVNALAFSPDGTKILSTGNDKTTRLWDVATGAFCVCGRALC